MNRSTWILLAVLAASLAWAYGANRPAPAPGKENLETVWNIPAASIKKVDYKSGETRVTLSIMPRKEGQGRYVWVEGEGLSTRPAAQRKKGRKQPPPPEPASSRDAFQGGAQAQKFLDEVANLQAVRALGVAKDFKLADFGLEGEEKAFLQLEREGASPLRLDLGTVAAGNATRYAVSSADGKLYLVRNATFRGLSNARRFMERELFPFPVQEAQRIELQDGGKKATLHRLNVPANEPNRWGRAPQENNGDPALQEVANSLLRIKALRYLPDADAGKGAPTLTVTLVKDGAPPSALRLYAAQKDEVLAVSSHTERPVGLNAGLAKTLLERVRAVLKR